MITALFFCSSLFVFGDGAWLGGYDALHDALAKDDLQSAKQAIQTFAQNVNGLDPSGYSEAFRTAWADQSAHLKMAIQNAEKAEGIDGVRAAFEHISMAVIVLAKAEPVEGYTEFHCPMAFNHKGANWLQKGEIANPYFGSSMLKCGAPVTAKKQMHKHKH